MTAGVILGVARARYSPSSPLNYHLLNLAPPPVLAAALELAAAPPLVAAAPPAPLRTEPVLEAEVSLLFCPVGCKRFIGIDGRFVMNLLDTAGPTMRTRKMMNIKKYNIANRITRRFLNLDCFNE